MEKYPKIQSIFKRDQKTHKFIEGEWSLPEFEYLKNNHWIWTEKVDGTNIRIIHRDGSVEIRGRTDNAQIPPFLYKELQEMFSCENFRELYPGTSIMCLYGEGYGARIQKGGGNYISDGVNFILFDVWIDGWWLDRNNMEDVAEKLGVKMVPIRGKGSLLDAIDVVKRGVKSMWGNFDAEGLVLKPQVQLFSRKGERIITKLKTKDF